MTKTDAESRKEINRRYRVKMRERIASDPVYAAKIKSQRDADRERRRARQREQYAKLKARAEAGDPDAIERMKRQKTRPLTPEQRARKYARHKERLKTDPDYLARWREAMARKDAKKREKRAAIRAQKPKLTAQQRAEERVKKWRERYRNDPEFRAKRLAEDAASKRAKRRRQREEREDKKREELQKPRKPPLRLMGRLEALRRWM